MSADNWKQRVYDSYMSNGFGDAHSLNREFELNRRYFKKNYLRYLPSDKNAKILELGCGMGQFYFFCQSEGYTNYEAIDASKENIAFIKEKLGQDARVSVGDILEFLRTADGKYDVVILNDVIEHLTKPEIFELLDGVHALLSEQGVFLIKTPNMANPYVNTAGRYIDITHEIGFTETSMRQVLRATGYHDIQVVGTDVYVLNPIISVLAKLVSKILNFFLFVFSALYGRTSIRVFEKDILAIAHK